MAIGGDLRPERLLLAYANGIFPWYSAGQPILWHSPDPRFVLRPADLKLSRSLRSTLRKAPFRITLDTAFREVVTACAAVPRPGQSGTWITSEMLDAYDQLHRLGFAHSAEAWLDDELVGGLYGVALGGLYAGESMFARASDASKVAFATFVPLLASWGFELIDCQVHTAHLERFGAVHIPREQYLRELGELILRPCPRGPWRADASRDELNWQPSLFSPVGG